MRQQTLAEGSFEQYRKVTRRERFLAEMDQVVPWAQLCALIEPVYPKPKGAGRRPIGLERMLRIYFMQQWFNLSDPAVEDGPTGGHSPVRSPCQGLHEQEGAPSPATDRARPSSKPHQVEGASQSRAPDAGDQAHLRLQKGPIPRARQEREPTVRDLRVGQPVRGTQGSARLPAAARKATESEPLCRSVPSFRPDPDWRPIDQTFLNLTVPYKALIVGDEDRDGPDQEEKSWCPFGCVCLRWFS